MGSGWSQLVLELASWKSLVCLMQAMPEGHAVEMRRREISDAARCPDRRSRSPRRRRRTSAVGDAGEVRRRDAGAGDRHRLDAGLAHDANARHAPRRSPRASPAASPPAMITPGREPLPLKPDHQLSGSTALVGRRAASQPRSRSIRRSNNLANSPIALLTRDARLLCENLATSTQRSSRCSHFVASLAA